MRKFTQMLADSPTYVLQEPCKTDNLLGKRAEPQEEDITIWGVHGTLTSDPSQLQGQDRWSPRAVSHPPMEVKTTSGGTPTPAVGSRGLEGYRLGRPRKVFWGRQDWGWVLSNGQDLETPPPPTRPQEGGFAGGGAVKAPEEKSAGEFRKGGQRG